jgi:hypothetical protein
VTKPQPGFHSSKQREEQGAKRRWKMRKTYTAPSPQSTPLTSFTRLRSSCRRLPAHCSAHVTVCCENFDLRSSTVRTRSRSSSPLLGTTFEVEVEVEVVGGLESDFMVTLCLDASMCCIGPWLRSYACGWEDSWSLDGVRKLESRALLVSHVRSRSESGGGRVYTVRTYL